MKLLAVLVPQSWAENGVSLSLKHLASPFAFRLHFYELALGWLSSSRAG